VFCFWYDAEDLNLGWVGGDTVPSV
jgi:hypothetical protein